MPTRLAGLATVVHPVPSAIDATVVAALALVAGADLSVALALAVAMFGFQAAIGAVNDVVDADADRLVKPTKPIPARRIGAPGAIALACLGALVGLAVSFAMGPLVGLLGTAGLATGIAYDLLPRRWGIRWLCFVPAFPLLLAWTWIAAAGILPPAWPALFAVAALAGPMIALANGLVDRDADVRTGRAGLAVALGQRRGWLVLCGLTVAIHGIAWATLSDLAPRPPSLVTLMLGASGTIAALVGLAGSASASARSREAGWLLAAVGLAALGVGWVAAVDPAGRAALASGPG